MSARRCRVLVSGDGNAQWELTAAVLMLPASQHNDVRSRTRRLFAGARPRPADIGPDGARSLKHPRSAIVPLLARFFGITDSRAQLADRSPRWQAALSFLSGGKDEMADACPMSMRGSSQYLRALARRGRSLREMTDVRRLDLFSARRRVCLPAVAPRRPPILGRGWPIISGLDRGVAGRSWRAPAAARRGALTRPGCRRESGRLVLAAARHAACSRACWPRDAAENARLLSREIGGGDMSGLASSFVAGAVPTTAVSSR